MVRPQHAAMQHAGQRQVVDEARPREHLVGNVDPRHGIAGQRRRAAGFGDAPGVASRSSEISSASSQ